MILASINSDTLMLISRDKCRLKTNFSYRNTNITLQMLTWPKTFWENIETLRKKSRLWDIKNGWTISTKKKIAFNSLRMRSCTRSNKSSCLSHKWRRSSKVCKGTSSTIRIISLMTSLLKSALWTLLAQCSLCPWRPKSSYSKNRKNSCLKHSKNTMRKLLHSNKI